MANLNSIMLIGRLTRDPELRHTKAGTAVANFSVAVNGRKDEDGNSKTTFFDCRAWGKLADVVAEYLTKGREVFLSGHVDQDSWTGKDGEKHQKLVVVAEQIQFLGAPKKAEAQAATPEPVAAAAAAASSEF